MTVLPGDRLRYWDIGEVAKVADWMLDAARGMDGMAFLDHLAAIAWSRPGFTAQIVMALALWVDPDEPADEPADERTARLREIARQKETRS